MTDKRRFDAIQSALVGLSVSDARELLYDFMNERLDNMIVESPGASPGEAALTQLAAAFGPN